MSSTATVIDESKLSLRALFDKFIELQELEKKCEQLNLKHAAKIYNASSEMQHLTTKYKLKVSLSPSKEELAFDFQPFANEYQQQLHTLMSYIQPMIPDELNQILDSLAKYVTSVPRKTIHKHDVEDDKKWSILTQSIIWRQDYRTILFSELSLHEKIRLLRIYIAFIVGSKYKLRSEKGVLEAMMNRLAACHKLI